MADVDEEFLCVCVVCERERKDEGDTCWDI